MNTLFFQFFHAKYFPTSSVLLAKLGHNPSFVWQGIQSGVSVLRKGVRWRIGNGKGTIIGEDPWLPTPSSFKPVTPLDLEWKQKPVEALIDEHTKTWNEDLVNTLFMSNEANVITGLPLSCFGAADKLVWHWSKNGLFSIKSACYQALEVLRDQKRIPRHTRHTREGSTQSKIPWSKIWKIDIPNKVKVFLWKVCNNILPTNALLHQRHCNDSPSCSIYGNANEDVRHVLLNCRVAKKVWKFWSRAHETEWIYQTRSFTDTLQEIIETKDNEDFACIAVLMWQIWFNHNRFILEGQKMDVATSYQHAIDLRNEYLIANKQQPSPLQQLQAPQVWSPPNSNEFKLNVDGATFESMGNIGIGAVIRNSRGDIMLAMSKKIDCNPSL